MTGAHAYGSYGAELNEVRRRMEFDGPPGEKLLEQVLIEPQTINCNVIQLKARKNPDVRESTNKWENFDVKYFSDGDKGHRRECGACDTLGDADILTLL